MMVTCNVFNRALWHILHNPVLWSVWFWMFNREVGVAKQVERRIVVDDDGDAVLVETETTGVVLDSEEGRHVLVQTAVRGLPLGNVRSTSSTPLIRRAYRDDEDKGCSCCCVLKWTLISILCLPCLPILCLCYFCCLKDTDAAGD